MSLPTPFPGGFTVLMAVWQGDDLKLFERATHSVFLNTLRPDAYVLVVDGPLPPPLTASIANLEAQFGIEVLHLPENQGLASALNAGLARVRTEWVVRADADDYNLPERFERLARVVAVAAPPDLLGSAILEVEPDGRPVAVRRTPSAHAEILRYAKRRNPFNHMTVAYRAALARRCGGYPQIHLKEDYALWASMLHEGAIALNLVDVLVHATAGRDMYRRRGGFPYARAEIELQRHLARCGVKSGFFAAVHGLLRGLVFVLPSGLRGWVYRSLLRSLA